MKSPFEYGPERGFSLSGPNSQNASSARQTVPSTGLSVTKCHKKKWPRSAALEVARDLCRALRPVTVPDRLIVAGSLRRRKNEVGDVEILYIPKFESERDGLFDTRQVNLVDRVLEALMRSGVLAPRRNTIGSEIWGEKNKLAVHVASGIPVDLFTAREVNWFNYLVCRTGSAENNVRIAATAKARGWQWNPYGAGFTDQSGTMVPVAREQDVFELLGLPYLEPWERN